MSTNTHQPTNPPLLPTNLTTTTTTIQSCRTDLDEHDLGATRTRGLQDPGLKPPPRGDRAQYRVASSNQRAISMGER